MDTLSGKVVLITGGSRGIGRAIAERLGRDGAIVVVAFARERAAAEEVVERIKKGRRSRLGDPGGTGAAWGCSGCVRRLRCCDRAVGRQQRGVGA
ncbi:SDR family NAD(P)-dependent oxidoreductase [Actinomadura sp. BRA 177]|uniref:SDR family NAD(P)-dependent oxidoreductase n=1 Tax=Actinomadura sp. BRA 177 TaxID=2745202 RepID=UPI0026E572D1|nr:SDR family NAD(P)-dependent oxidoreductase [Actinomadura sp. BRA 177]